MTVLAWPYRYVAWNADNDIYNEQPLEPLPFIYGDEQWVVNGEGPRYEISLPRSLRLNLAVMPSFVSDKMYLRNRTKAALATDQVFANSTFLQCSMVNATYHADFKFPNGAQDVQYEAIPLSEELVEPANWIDGPPNPWLPAAPMRANPKCSSVRSSDPDLQGSICSFDAQVFQRLSYQALMQVFSSLFIGFLFGRNDHPSRTSMPETVIWDHPTVKAIHVDPTALDNKTFSFQEAVAKAQSPLFQGLSADDLHVPTGSLADAIEALFQKIVIGAMAEESFQPNARSAFAPPPTNVTFNTYHNVYVYSAPKLWIAYGIAILAATLTSVFGLTIIFTSGHSYGQRFSSVFLFAKGAEVDHHINPADETGRDPLPKYLAGAKAVSAVSVVKDGSGKGDQISTSSGYELIARAQT